MTRFRPTVESLGERVLPSAVIATSDNPTSEPVPSAMEEVRLADQPGEPATGGEVTFSLNFPKIVFKHVPQSGE